MKAQRHHELLWELIVRWYSIECEIAGDPITFPPARAAPLETIVAVAKERVINVLCGANRWDECSQGDRAIWMMRTRMSDEVIPPSTIKEIAEEAWNASQMSATRQAARGDGETFERWFNARRFRGTSVRHSLNATMSEIEAMTPEESTELHPWET